MGRKKIDNTEKINEPKKRQVTFNKRSKGAAVKLLELHNLCGAQIFSVIISETGKMIVVNAGGSPSDLINKYNYLKNNNKIFKEFTKLPLEPISKKEDEKSSLEKETSLNESNDFYLNNENKKLVLENEENESLSFMNDFLVEKLI